MPKVKGKEQLCSCEKKYFKSIQGFDGHTLFDRYDDIENVVNKEIDKKFQDFLAQPIIEGDTITWYSKPYNDNPQRLAELQGEEQVKYEKIKNETIMTCKDVQGFKPELYMVGLWRHECERVFCDKLVNNKDKDTVLDAIHKISIESFGM